MRGSITVSAEVDIDDIIDELDDDDLREACKERGIIISTAAVENRREKWTDLADEMRRALQERNALHFEVLLLCMNEMAGVPRLRILGAKAAE